MELDDKFDNLRYKLDTLGYTQPLPLSGVSIVSAIFEDLVKTTESLRDSKLQISKLLEEKTCWELGTEPYKCDNSKLLAEVNSLHMDLIKQREHYEAKCLDYIQKIRHLEADKRHLEDHSSSLEHQIRELSLRHSDSKSLKLKKDGVNMNKKPFISTVKSGALIPNPHSDHVHSAKCHKCGCSTWSKSIDGGSDIHKLENEIKGYSDQVNFLKEKVKAREREIERLNNALSGGRPSKALAKDCCYKNVGMLSEDVDFLQEQKNEVQKKLLQSQECMHEARNRAIILDERNKKLEKELSEFEKTALNLERQANLNMTAKEKEIAELRFELQSLRKKLGFVDDHSKSAKRSVDFDYNTELRTIMKTHMDEKRELHDKINKLKLNEQQNFEEINKLSKTNLKLKCKLDLIEADKEGISRYDKSALTTADEELLRYKTERDFFQKEYLKLLEKTTIGDAECIKSQLCVKDREINRLRSELSQLRCQSGRTESCMASSPGIAVQAAIIRAERETDVVRADLELIKVERDSLREKLKRSLEQYMTEKQTLEEHVLQQTHHIAKLERDAREARTSTVTGKTHATLLEQELEELRKRNFELQAKNSELSTSINQYKILQDQTDKALVDHQNKLVISETHLHSAEMRLSALETNRESSRNDLRNSENEISALKSINNILEAEKEKLLADLDSKTESLYKFEAENTVMKKRNQDLERSLHNLQERIEGISNESKKHESELQGTTTERKKLRHELSALKAVRDEMMAENGRLSNELADSQASISQSKKKLKDSEKEVERLRLQLQHYVQEVQRAEELLMNKEQERDEMLEHYRSLSHDAVILEGNNQSLENEAAEQKRQLLDAEKTIVLLKQDLIGKDQIIDKFDIQVTALSKQVSDLQQELDQCYDDQRLVKIDLDAMKELCEKLDLQKDKLNAELEECGQIRKQLERENERLRKELKSVRSGDKSSTDSYQELLIACRQDLDVQRKLASQYKQDVSKLKDEVAQLKSKLSEAKTEASRSEALAKEYNVQVQELRHDITNERFQLARSREQSPRYPTL